MGNTMGNAIGQWHWARAWDNGLDKGQDNSMGQGFGIRARVLGMRQRLGAREKEAWGKGFGQGHGGKGVNQGLREWNRHVARACDKGMR